MRQPMRVARSPFVLPNGERATRIGCRIVASDDVMEKIVKRFVIDCQ